MSTKSFLTIIFSVLIGFGLFSGCGQGFHPATQTLSQNLTQSLGCADFKSLFWEQLYGLADQGRGFPTSHELAYKLSQNLHEGLAQSGRYDPVLAERLRTALTHLYSLLAEHPEVQSGDRTKIQSFLVSTELGSRVTKSRAALQDQVAADLQTISELAAASGANCQTGGDTAGPSGTPSPTNGTAATTPPGTLFEQWASTEPKAVVGAWKVMSTAYQSCDVVAMPALTGAIPDVQGISIVGTYPDGIGLVRVVSAVSELVQTDYYYQQYHQPASNCFAVRSDPLIYDYGGKPYATSSLNSELNLFKNAGSGSSALGVDCSGFITSALLAGGLKLSAGVPARAAQASGVPARMYMDPQTNGLDCLAPISVAGSANDLQPGDIIASSGHVVMVDQVGHDPLGIASITSAAACASAIAISHFNFTIIQSSPIKGGIGINRILATDYMPGSEFATGLLEYAQAACLAKFQGRSSIPAPRNTTVVRHSSSAACNDRQIALTNEKCIASCPAVASRLTTVFPF